ncbi:MAG: hypothetical protein RIC15_10080 [Vicingaceae bacterium]
MSILSGKHITKEVDGVRCSIVEKGVSEKRSEFLKELLEFNGYEVKIEKVDVTEEGAEETFTIGVTSMLFNPVIAVYQRMLRTKDGRLVTPDYYNQKTDNTEPNYWDRGKKDF